VFEGKAVAEFFSTQGGTNDKEKESGMESVSEPDRALLVYPSSGCLSDLRPENAGSISN